MRYLWGCFWMALAGMNAGFCIGDCLTGGLSGLTAWNALGCVACVLNAYLYTRGGRDQ